jgi:hypothetical protein
MKHNARLVTSVERFGDRRVSWTSGLPARIKRRLRKLFAAYAGYLPGHLVVGFDPEMKTRDVYSCHPVGGGGGLLLNVGSRWWGCQNDRIEYDLIMSLAVAQLAAAGLLRAGTNGMELDEAEKLGIEPIDYLNSLVANVIHEKRLQHRWHVGRVGGIVTRELHTLVNPRVAIPPDATHVDGISNADVPGGDVQPLALHPLS